MQGKEPDLLRINFGDSSRRDELHNVLDSAPEVFTRLAIMRRQGAELFQPFGRLPADTRKIECAGTAEPDGAHNLLGLGELRREGIGCFRSPNFASGLLRC